MPPLDPFDLWDTAAITDLVVRPITTTYEDQPRLGDLIAPLRDINGFEAKLQVRGTFAFGKGQFRALDASPTLFKASQEMREEIQSLLMLDEMPRVGEKQFMELSSPDPTVRANAGVDLVTLGTMLALRNERLTEWMRWKSFSGELYAEYPSGQQVYVNYGLNPLNKPTAAVLWSDTVNSDPVADMKAWSNRLAVSSGNYGLRWHMASETFEYLQNNAKIRGLLTPQGRTMMIPTEDDIMSLLRSGTTITLYDNGYRDESAGNSIAVPDSLTRYLPPGYVLLTTEYVIEGLPIAETLNGQVMISAGYNAVSIVTGPVSEVLVDQFSHNHFFRQASARLPRLLKPECFLWGRVA